MGPARVRALPNAASRVRVQFTVPSRSVAVAYRLRHNSMRWEEQCGKKHRGNTRGKKKKEEKTLLHI